MYAWTYAYWMFFDSNEQIGVKAMRKTLWKTINVKLFDSVSNIEDILIDALLDLALSLDKFGVIWYRSKLGQIHISKDTSLLPDPTMKFWCGYITTPYADVKRSRQ